MCDHRQPVRGLQSKKGDHRALGFGLCHVPSCPQLTCFGLEVYREKERCDQNIPPLDCMPPPPAHNLSSPAGQRLTWRGWSRGAGVQDLQSSSHAPDTAVSRPALVLVGVSVLLPLSPSDTTMVPGPDGRETRWSPDGPTAAVSPHAYIWCSRTAPTTLP